MRYEKIPLHPDGIPRTWKQRTFRIPTNNPAVSFVLVVTSHPTRKALRLRLFDPFGMEFWSKELRATQADGVLVWNPVTANWEAKPHKGQLATKTEYRKFLGKKKK